MTYQASRRTEVHQLSLLFIMLSSPRFSIRRLRLVLGVKLCRSFAISSEHVGRTIAGKTYRLSRLHQILQNSSTWNDSASQMDVLRKCRPPISQSVRPQDYMKDQPCYRASADGVGIDPSSGPRRKAAGQSGHRGGLVPPTLFWGRGQERHI